MRRQESANALSEDRGRPVASTLLICADATPRMGTGHVMRCLALAAAARERDFSVWLASRISVPWLRDRIQHENFACHLLAGDAPVREQPARMLAERFQAQRPDWVILDGYHFASDCHKAVRAAGSRLLIIDDYAHLPEYSCDLLLNQNPGADGLSYKGHTGRMLLGPQYALLRSEFAAARPRAVRRDFSEAATLLLTLGGGDFSGHLARLVPALTMPELAGRRLRVLAGAMPPEYVAALLRDCPARVELLGRVDDMPALLLDTDLCITAGGSTCWELCCLGVPFLTLEVAENQRNICAWLAEHDIAPAFSAEALGRLLTSAELRGAHAARVRALTDGTGADAVVGALLERA